MFREEDFEAASRQAFEARTPGPSCASAARRALQGECFERETPPLREAAPPRARRGKLRSCWASSGESMMTRTWATLGRALRGAPDRLARALPRRATHPPLCLPCALREIEWVPHPLCLEKCCNSRLQKRRVDEAAAAQSGGAGAASGAKAPEGKPALFAWGAPAGQRARPQVVVKRKEPESVPPPPAAPPGAALAGLLGGAYGSSSSGESSDGRDEGAATH